MGCGGVGPPRKVSFQESEEPGSLRFYFGRFYLLTFWVYAAAY